MNIYKYHYVTMAVELLHCLTKKCTNTREQTDDDIVDWYCDKHSQYDVIHEILEPYLYADVINLCLEFYGKDSIAPKKFTHAITTVSEYDDDEGREYTILIGNNSHEAKLLYSAYIGDWLNVEYQLHNNYYDISQKMQERCVLLAMHSGYSELSWFLLHWFTQPDGNMFLDLLD